MKRITTISVLAAFLVFALSAINLITNRILGIESSTAEAGPLAERLESKHKPSPRSQAVTQGGDF